MLLINDVMEIVVETWIGLVAVLYLILGTCCYFFYQKFYKKKKMEPIVSDQELQRIQKEIKDWEVKKRRTELRRIK